MTQQPFTRPGAVDLSGLKRPAGAAGQAAAGGGGGAPAGGSSYWLDITEQNFQATIEASLTAPVLLAFYSPTRLPESEQMARDLATVAEEYEGRFLAGLVDIDTQPAIAQAVQLQSVPFVFAVIDGRPQPLIQDVLPLDGLRAAVNQVMQQLTTQGITGRHQPRSAAPAAPDDDGEPQLDPRYAPAQDALERNDFEGAVAEYQKLLSANPADAEAAAGLAMAQLLAAHQGRRSRRCPRAGGREPRRRRRADPGRRSRHARRSCRRRVRPPRRRRTPHRRRRPQPGPRAPARSVRGGRQRRPAGAQGPTEPRVRAVLSQPPASAWSAAVTAGDSVMLRRCSATTSRVGTGSWASRATSSSPIG